jgi:hypothetical protein
MESGIKSGKNRKRLKIGKRWNKLRGKRKKSGGRRKVKRKKGRISRYKKFWKELICLLSLHYLKMSFELKPAFSPT